MKKSSAVWSLIIVLAIIKFILPIIVQSPVYELQRDEYLYYAQGQHFDLGYLENPPLLSWLGMISSGLGGSVFWIKFWPCLFGAATVIVTCLITAELGGRFFAQLLAGLGVIGGAYLRTHYLFQPNILDVFFWTLSIYFLVRYINTQKQGYVFCLAISLAFGLLGKYSVLFTIIAIVIGLVLSPYRNVLLKKKTWLAACLLVAIMIPNLLYQWYFNWPLLHHMEELQDTQLKYINKGDFIREQFLMLIPALIIWIAGLVWVLRNKQWRIIGIIYFVAILLLLFGSGKGYYALGTYPMLLAAGGVAWERIGNQRKWVRYTVAIWVIVLNLLLLPMALPVWNPEKQADFYKRYGIKHKWEDQQNHPLPQDFADMLGWKELAAKTEKFYLSLSPEAQSRTFIYCGNYGQAGALKYYGKDERFKNRVVSQNGSFVLWIPGRFYFQNLILVNDRPLDMTMELFRHVEKITTVDSVTYKLSRQYGNTVTFLENIDHNGADLIRARVNNAKQQFER